MQTIDIKEVRAMNNKCFEINEASLNEVVGGVSAGPYIPSPGIDDLLPSIKPSRRPGCVVPIVRPLPPKSPAVHVLEVTVTESR